MTSCVGQHPPPGSVWQSSVQNMPMVRCGHAGGAVCTHCCCTVSGGQTKQWLCAVGVGCMAAAMTPGCCTGVPIAGGGQFGLTAILQICGCVIGKQLIGSVTQVSEQMK